ncbi:MAG: putative metallohydrolase [Candidatus Methanolliviera sp. GoM_asphalt]|nr:MAG: putative metallohydrolase [Candidatus Methanolliviera sp. GoM_asphalt]
MDIEEIKREVKDREKELIDLTRDLIRFKSVSGEEGEISAYIKDFFEDIGFSVEMIGKNVLASEKKMKKDPVLILNGHIDVVPAEESGWKHPPFEPFLSNGRIYGRGSCDMKGGLASMIFALKILHEEGVEIGDDILFTATVEEETGGINGAGSIVEGLNGKMCVIAEPTDLKICIGHKGSAIYRVTVEGRSAHGSMPHLGKNAIYYASKMIIALEESKFDKEDKFLGKPTINVGKIEGGERVNVVPDRCVFEIDRRIIPGEDREEVFKEILEIVKQENEEVNVEEVISMLPMKISEDEEVVSILKKVTKEVFGEAKDVIGMDGCSDARFFAEKYIPTVLFGPGKDGIAHTRDEFVDVKDLLLASVCFVDLIVSVI